MFPIITLITIALIITTVQGGPLACLAAFGACAIPCITTGPFFTACVSASCGLSSYLIAPICMAPTP